MLWNALIAASGHLSQTTTPGHTYPLSLLQFRWQSPWKYQPQGSEFPPPLQSEQSAQSQNGPSQTSFQFCSVMHR